jgi:hypothetical protein
MIDSGLAPASPNESAILTTLPSDGTGLAYTVVLRGRAGSTGVGLVEVYDLDRDSDSQLANISTRGFAQADDGVLIGGLIVSGTDARKVILRAIGPSLPVEGRLLDPQLELYDSQGTLLQANDNWRSDQEAEIAASTIAPAHENEAAIVRTLAPAAYTAIVRGINSTTGVALVEAYGIP